MADSSTRMWPLEDTELAPALRLITTLARADMGVLMLLDDAAHLLMPVLGYGLTDSQRGRFGSSRTPRRSVPRWPSIGSCGYAMSGRARRRGRIGRVSWDSSTPRSCPSIGQPARRSVCSPSFIARTRGLDGAQRNSRARPRTSSRWRSSTRTDTCGPSAHARRSAGRRMEGAVRHPNESRACAPSCNRSPATSTSCRRAGGRPSRTTRRACWTASPSVSASSCI